ncbi:MAG: ATP-binding cassette domain-containing protein [Anaerolineales bacterium]|nr:ATP-binding cassette domain-containing protein [Anaerolineales bacterium]
MSLIEVRDLHKHFRVTKRQNGRFSALRTLFTTEFDTKVAVDGISFTIEQGEMVGYVGPNGAGKSTSVKMLTGILVPTSGHIQVAGLVPHQQRQEHVRHIGVVFGQKTQLWWDVAVIESLRLLKEIYKIPDATYRHNLDLFNDLLDLYEFQHTPVRQLSLGQRMRADLAAALLHSPDILFLDEPTIGVDVVAKERFRTFITELNQTRGTTVLLTTHDMADIEKVCQRMMVIDKGRVIYDGGLEAMKDRFMPYRVLEVEFQPEVAMEGVGVETAVFLHPQHVQFMPQPNHTGQKARFRFDRRHLSATDLITRLVQQYPIKDIRIEEPDIETIVRDIYQHGVG